MGEDQQRTDCALPYRAGHRPDECGRRVCRHRQHGLQGVPGHGSMAAAPHFLACRSVHQCSRNRSRDTVDRLRYVFRVLIPSNDALLEAGIFKSVDSGETWFSVQNPPSDAPVTLDDTAEGLPRKMIHQLREHQLADVHARPLCPRRRQDRVLSRSNRRHAKNASLLRSISDLHNPDYALTGHYCPLMTSSALRRFGSKQTTTASADFCQPIPTPCDVGSTRQADRSPRVRRATFTLMPVGFTS